MKTAESGQANWENTATVFGGDGAWGRKTVELFEKLGFKTNVCEIEDDPLDMAKKSRVLFFSVNPTENIRQIAGRVTPIIGREHIILENASAKDQIKSSLLNLADLGASVCSTHPMCDPVATPDLTEVPLLLMDVGQNSAEARDLAERLFEPTKMRVVPFDFETHDKGMKVIQFMVHFLQRTVGSFLAEEGVDLSSLLQIATPNFHLFHASLMRTLTQDPQVSATIINSALQRDETMEFAQRLAGRFQRVIDMSEGERLEEFDKSAKALGQKGLR